MADRNPHTDGVTTQDVSGKSTGTSGALAYLLRVLALVALLIVVWLDETNPDWNPPTLVLVGLIATLLGITGREAVDLLKHKLGGK